MTFATLFSLNLINRSYALLPLRGAFLLSSPFVQTAQGVGGGFFV